MIKIFDDGVLEAVLYPSKWVFVRWIQNKRGKLQKSLIKDLFHMEQLIFTQKLAGWFTDSELDHKDFHRLLVKFGASPNGIVDGYQRFLKPITNQGDLHVR